MKSFITFKYPYLLIEDIKAKYQPIFKEYKKEIPSLNFDSPILSCPFIKKIEEKSKIKTGEKEKPGYCEICCSKFTTYNKHVNSKAHLSFAENCSNYKYIDLFIEAFNREEKTFVPSSPCDFLERSLKNDTIGSSLFMNDESENFIRISEESEYEEKVILSLDNIIYNINNRR